MLESINERLAILETKMTHLDECIDEAKFSIHELTKSISDLQKTVWKASGAIVALLGLIELLGRIGGHV